MWPDAPPAPTEPDIIIYPEPIESWAQRRRRLLWLDDPCCVWCGFLFVDPDFATIEHLFPTGYGGGNTMSNTRLACHHCNQMRGKWYDKILRKLERWRERGCRGPRPIGR